MYVFSWRMGGTRLGDRRGTTEQVVRESTRATETGTGRRHVRVFSTVSFGQLVSDSTLRRRSYFGRFADGRTSLICDSGVILDGRTSLICGSGVILDRSGVM